MGKKETKTEKAKLYDFRHLREEVAIGIFDDSDLSKTLANYIYKNTSELFFVKLALDIHNNGCARIEDNVVAVLVKSIKKSDLKWSVKVALLGAFGEETPSINNLK